MARPLRITQRIDDVDTSVDTDAPTGWETPTGGGLNLVTDFESDREGDIHFSIAYTRPFV